MKKNKGITLIALIITIVVMLILVAVSVNILIKSNLIGTAEKTVDKYKAASEEERKEKTVINGEKYNSIEEYIEASKEYKGLTITADTPNVEFTKADGTTPGDINNLEMGDIVKYGDYEYHYNQKYYTHRFGAGWSDDETIDGWGVKALDRSKEKYGELCGLIYGKNLKNIDFLFGSGGKPGSQSIIKAPEIPYGVVFMSNTFAGCRNLKKVTKDDINVYGQINNPLEGNNEIYLKVSTSQRVNYDFKNPVMIVTLEKIISEDKSIKVDITGSGKNNVDNIMLQDNIDKVSVSGPRSLVNKVKRVVGTVKVNGELNDFSQSIKLEPVDANGKVVEGIELEKDSVNVNIILLAQKTVPIILKLSDNSESGVNYTMSQNTVTIKGKKDIVDSINDIETQPVKLSEILPGTSKDIYLQVPSGITIETKYITINKNSEENTLEEYTYTAKDIEIRNNTENIDKSKIKFPNSINVSIEYLQSEGSINKDDIKLYIDLNEVSLEDNTCKIKYESIYEIEKINIDPDIVTIEES